MSMFHCVFLLKLKSLFSSIFPGGLIFSSEAGDFGGETSQSVLNEGESWHIYKDALSRDVNAFDRK